MKVSMSKFSKLHEKPILMAVSILSPVSTHSLIPALLMKEIVSATSSYSLSSIAVEPIRLKSYSIFSATMFKLSSRLYVDINAC